MNHDIPIVDLNDVKIHQEQSFRMNNDKLRNPRENVTEDSFLCLKFVRKLNKTSNPLAVESLNITVSVITVTNFIVN